MAISHVAFKKRHFFTREEIDILWETSGDGSLAIIYTRKKLALRLGLTREEVTSWFKNRRIKKKEAMGK